MFGEREDAEALSLALHQLPFESLREGATDETATCPDRQ